MSVSRRTFLSTAVPAGILAYSGPAGAETPSGAPIQLQGMTKGELPTPALLLDLPAFEANLRTMADHCRKAGCAFRPHAKTHKCPEIGRRQVASGAAGVCTATVPEAEAMVAGGIRTVLLTSPIVEPGKIARMVALVKHNREVLLSVGHPREAELLEAAAQAEKVTVKVLVDLDVGDRRTGILPGESALDLARLIARSKHLQLQGLQAYAGHASHVVGFERRGEVSRKAVSQAVETRGLLAKNGLKISLLSGGSTGTYNLDSQPGGLNELQVGSYIFMDVDYRRIGGRDGAVYTDFQPSLTVLTTVVSVSPPDRVTVDAGTKAFSTDVPFAPEARSREGLTYRRAGDEFGSLAANEGNRLPGIGERLEFIVPHCDPTVNLYDRIYAVRGDQVEAAWPIMARREIGFPPR